MSLSPRVEIFGLVGLMVGFGLARLTTSSTVPPSAPAAAPAQPTAAPTVAEPSAVDPAAAPAPAAARASSRRLEEPTWELVADLERQVAELLEQTADLAEELERAKKEARTRVALPAASLGMDQPAAGWGTLTPNALRHDLTLDPAVAALLGLDETEVAFVDTAVRTARSVLDRLETAHARVTEQTDTSVTVAIDPFEEDGNRVRDELLRALTTTLGADRGAKLLEQMTGRSAQSFAHFGKATQTITATRIEEDRYRLQTTQKVVNATGGSSHSTSIRVANDLPANVAHLIELP